MDIPITTEVYATPEMIAESMTIVEIASLLGAVAERLDEDFEDRAFVAREFADATSEKAARFLCEIIAQRGARNSDV